MLRRPSACARGDGKLSGETFLQKSKGNQFCADLSDVTLVWGSLHGQNRPFVSYLSVVRFRSSWLLKALQQTGELHTVLCSSFLGQHVKSGKESKSWTQPDISLLSLLPISDKGRRQFLIAGLVGSSSTASKYLVSSALAAAKVHF
jgi:hypothetical protein